MALFMNDKELKAKNVALTAQLEEMEAASASSITELAAAKEEIVGKTQEFTESTALATELKAQVETLTADNTALTEQADKDQAEFDTKLTAEKDATTAAESSAESKAKEMLQSMGHNPVELMTDEGKSSHEAVMSEYNAFDISQSGDAEKRKEFRRKNSKHFPGG